MAIQVFVPMPDERFDARELTGVRLVPYRVGMALWASVAAAAQPPPVTAPAPPATPGDRLP